MASLQLNNANAQKNFTTPAPLARISAASTVGTGNEPTLEIQTVPAGAAPVWGPLPISINATKIPVGAGGLAAGTQYRFVANFMAPNQTITISFT